MNISDADKRKADKIVLLSRCGSIQNGVAAMEVSVLFDRIATALAEGREKCAAVCDGLVTFTEEHGCVCDPCAWCTALETAAEKIRTP